MSPAPDPEAIDAALAFAERLADVARLETGPRFRAGVVADDKAAGDTSAVRFDPVTEADRAAEVAIRAAIAAERPDDGIEGEELSSVEGSGPWRWTIDPVDGTTAFVCGLPLWTTLIALAFEGRPVVGLIDAPALGERYLGDGRRAWRIGPDGERARLSVRACESLTKAALSTTDHALFNPAEAAAFEQVRRASRLQRYGAEAYAYALVAAGRLDLVIEAGLKSHDVRALGPVVTGAGGLLTDWFGRSGPDSGQVAAAGDARVLEEALVALRRSAT